MKTDYLRTYLLLFSFCLVSGISQTLYAEDMDHAALELACRYEMTFTPASKAKASPKKQAWYFWRQPGRVQTMDADGDYGEIWQETANDTIYYRKLYHSDKTAVEYLPADNPTNNLNFDWVKLSHMLSQHELDQLKPVKTLRVFGRTAELRKGKVHGETLDVKWLMNENLPASIVRKDKLGTTALRLVEMSTIASAKQKPYSIEELADYRHIEAVDFGDMENDPFVKKVLAAEGHHH